MLSKSHRLLLVPLAALLMAQAPIPDPGRLVRNIDDQPGFSGLTNLVSLTSAGDRAFFLLTNEYAGLWTTTGAGGEKVYLGRFDAFDLSAERGKSVATESGLLFQDRYGELFFSDGTVAGTQNLFAASGDDGRPQLRSGLVPVGDDRWAFTASNSGGDTETLSLWVTDGTEAGSEKLAALNEASFSFSEQRGPSSRIGDRGLFISLAAESSNFGEPSSLWLTDGSSAGTRILATIPRGFSLFLDGAHENRSVFTVTDSLQPTTMEVWSTDGTAAGTKSFSLNPLEGNRFYVPASAPLGSGWAFIARSTTFDGLEPCNLWVTDGSEAGTRLVVSLSDLVEVLPGEEIGFDACPSELVSSGGRVFFSYSSTVGDVYTEELWASDGTAAGTRELSHLSAEGEQSRVHDLQPWNGGVAFRGEGPSGPDLLYISDGTPEGTLPLSSRAEVGIVQRGGEKLWFSVFTGSPLRAELWLTEGTATSERRIAQLAEVEDSSSPRGLLPFQDRVYFRTGGSFSPESVWATDGTRAGTEEFDLSSLWTFVIRPSRLKVIGDELYLADQSSILATDGTVEGSRIVVPWQLYSFNGPEFAKLGSRLFFAGGDGESGSELWVRDDDAEEPELFLDINPGLHPDPEYPDEFYPNSSFPTQMQTWQDRIVFSASTEELGTQLWVTDGTRAGTRALPPSPELAADTGFISEILPIGDRVFFHRFSSGLWVSDGTAGGTRPVLTTEGEQLGGFAFAELRGRCLVLDIGQGLHGPSALWLTDGTPEGTRKITEVPARVDYGHQLAVSGGKAFMVLSSAESGNELWVTDGTAEGTHLVKDIAPGPDSPDIQGLRAVDGVVMFSAEDPLLGSEPWVSDGTAEGTRLVADIRPEKESSNPAEFVAFQDDVLFSAYRNDVGRELFAIDRDLVRGRCIPSPRRLCLQDGRYSVEVDWRDQRRGGFGVGTSSGHSDDTGFFWFFREDNVELVVKVLDGRQRNEHFWYFSGALSDVEYWITVTDHDNGRVRTFHNPPGNLCGRGETAIFREGDAPITDTAPGFLQEAPAPGAVDQPVETVSGGQGCTASPNALLLRDGRFAVEVDWETSRQGGRSGLGTPVSGTDESGYFWFFNPDNLELVVKILDGRASNGKFWVLYGALSDVGYEIRVTDLETCSTRTYRNAETNICGQADIQAF